MRLQVAVLNYNRRAGPPEDFHPGDQPMTAADAMYKLAMIASSPDDNAVIAIIAAESERYRLTHARNAIVARRAERTRRSTGRGRYTQSDIDKMNRAALDSSNDRANSAELANLEDRAGDFIDRPMNERMGDASRVQARRQSARQSGSQSARQSGSQSARQSGSQSVHTASGQPGRGTPEYAAALAAAARASDEGDGEDARHGDGDGEDARHGDGELPMAKTPDVAAEQLTDEARAKTPDVAAANPGARARLADATPSDPTLQDFDAAMAAADPIVAERTRRAIADEATRQAALARLAKTPAKTPEDAS
jgi:hypothetical protein